LGVRFSKAMEQPPAKYLCAVSHQREARGQGLTVTTKGHASNVPRPAPRVAEAPPCVRSQAAYSGINMPKTQDEVSARSGSEPIALPHHVDAPGRWLTDHRPERSGSVSECIFCAILHFLLH